jgi:Acylphosphatase
MTGAGERAYRLWVSGRVQGVGFRWFARRAALGLGLTGRVRNLPDAAWRSRSREPRTGWTPSGGSSAKGRPAPGSPGWTRLSFPASRHGTDSRSIAKERGRWTI